jgi:hypothetical protein
VAFAWAAQTFRISSETRAGHRDCRAGHLLPRGEPYAHVTSGNLKRRIDDLLAAGTVNLQQICGPDAAATVADIEAGR